jgi:two-component sensor histidine kinase
LSLRLKGLFLSSSLGVRLGSTLVLALLPLGILSVIQAQSAQREIELSTLEGVAGASLRAVQPQIDLIKDAQVSARVLSAALTFALEEGVECTGRVKAVAETIPEATLVAYIPLSGLMTCSSTDDVVDFKGVRVFQRLIARPEPMVIYNPMGPVSKTAVIGIGQPVFDRDGEQLGIVAISLPYLSVAPQDYSDAAAPWEPSYLATYGPDSALLISSDGTITPEQAVPPGFPLQDLPTLADTAAYYSSDQGRRIVSVTSVADDLYLLAVWQRRSLGFWTRAGDVMPYVIPVLTWVAALAAAGWASSQLVVRHVRALSRSMSEYMSNRTQVSVRDIELAPTEIQRLHAVYHDLIRNIEQDEAELQNLIVDKDVLLREVNHRSGNSLQVIASVMRMYRREATDDSLRSVLDSLINRVIALSSTHTSLYSMSGRRDVPMDDILAGVVRRLKEIHGVALGVAKKDFQPIRMPAEAAIPLALALAETVSCLFTARSVATEGVAISLSEQGDHVHLSVTGPAVPEFQPETTAGLASLPRRMLQQFATQLRGKITIRVEDGRSMITLDVPREA